MKGVYFIGRKGKYDFNLNKAMITSFGVVA